MHHLPIPEDLRSVLANAPGRCLLVGGCVRDFLFGIAPKDYDIEVYGTDYAVVCAWLKQFGRVDVVGRCFGVAKFTSTNGNTYDFSLPRRETKTGKGHRDFAIAVDPTVGPSEAAARRDFTMNALAYDPRAGEILDYFGGIHDIERRILRHTSDHFSEEPLRVLRGMQFCGRYNLTADPSTLKVCRDLGRSQTSLQHWLSTERVREEWVKWATRSSRPSAGMRFLKENGWWSFFPQLAWQVPQDPIYHPEGGVFEHTSYAVDALADMTGWQSLGPDNRLVYMLATLVHDVGKGLTMRTRLEDGVLRISSPGHAQEGTRLARDFLISIGMGESVIERVNKLVDNHMVFFDDDPPSARAVRRLSNRLAPDNLEGLALVVRADCAGRPLPVELPQSLVAALATARELKVASHAPIPLLRGQDLIDRGEKPGKQFGVLLKQAYEAQLNGAFVDRAGAAKWMDGYLARNLAETDAWKWAADLGASAVDARTARGVEPRML